MGDSSYLNLSDFTLLASVIAILCKLSNFQIFLGTLLFVLWINVRIILILFLIVDRLRATPGFNDVLILGKLC